MKSWQKFPFKNISYTIIGIVIGLLVSQFEAFHGLLLSFENYAYLGAFVAGILYVSSYTFTTGAVVLLVLAEKLNPYGIIFFAGLGSMLGDIIIFRHVKNNISHELRLIYHYLFNHRFLKALPFKTLKRMLPILGLIFIISPLPDEIGISLLGISKMKTTKFILLSIVFNFISITLVMFASNYIKP
jgi:hypothetical protein